MNFIQHRSILFMILSGFLPLCCFSQNLVPNPGFEEYSGCTDPPSNNSLEYCDFWFNALEPLVSCDWFSSCFPNGSPYSIPNTLFGNSFPYSGDAFLGFAPYSQYTNKGESFGVRLTEPLIADSAYCFGFYYKNSKRENWDYTNYEFNVAFLTDTLGINSAPDVSNYTALGNYNESEDWNFFSDYYIAEGGEEYFLIGVFNPFPNYYVHQPTPPNEYKYMYYFIDDVSVIPCNKDSLLSVVLELPNVFTPNGDTANEFYAIKKHNIESLSVQIFNRWGNVVSSYDGLLTEWDGKDQNSDPVSEGVYFVKAVATTRFGETFSTQQCVYLVR